jgi:hypothetical protein
LPHHHFDLLCSCVEYFALCFWGWGGGPFRLAFSFVD